MSHAQAQIPRYTVEDYLSWDDERRYELIEGEAYLMAPAPSLHHQSIALSLASQMRALLEARKKALPACPCQVFVAPVDVVLGPTTVVQPDVILVCDAAKLANGRNVQGAPDLAVEVVSPATARHDRLVKRDLYERVGVAHYWLADPEALTLECYRLEGGAYGKPAVYGPGERVDLPYCGGFALDLTEVFGPPPVPGSRGPESGIRCQGTGIS
jgi:Uma2 family endonuclease